MHNDMHRTVHALKKRHPAARMKQEEHMEKLYLNLANLLKVKTLVTLAVMLVFCVLALTGRIEGENVMYVVTSVIAFYFGTQHEKKGETL